MSACYQLVLGQLRLVDDACLGQALLRRTSLPGGAHKQNDRRVTWRALKDCVRPCSLQNCSMILITLRGLTCQLQTSMPRIHTAKRKVGH